MNYELEAYVGELKFLRDFYRKNTVKTEQKPDYPGLGEARYKEDVPFGAEPLSALSMRHRSLRFKFPQYSNKQIWVESFSGGYLDRSRDHYFVMVDGKKVTLENDWGGYA